jgi:hypothetical protein
MWPLKLISLAQFLRLLIQAHDLMIFGHLNLKCASNFDFGKLQSISFDEAIDNRYVFELLVNALVLHSRISCVYEFLLNQKLGDWVKARSTTWYS